MDETGFRAYLKQKRRSASTIEKCVLFSVEFETYLGKQAPPRGLDESSMQDIQTFSASHRYKNSVLWALGRYYEFSGNQSLKQAASRLRVQEIEADRDRKKPLDLAKLPEILPDQVERLRRIGISSQADLLSRCATREGRDQVASSSGLAHAILVNLVRQADVSRIVDIKNKRVKLLLQAEIDSVSKIASCEPGHLQRILDQANRAMNLLRRAPTLVETTYWVQQARELPILIQD